MSNPRVHDDGTLVFPERGDPPPDQSGYDREAGNPFIFRPAMVPCIFRTRQVLERHCASCKDKPPMTYFGCQKALPVSPSNCKKCTERKES